MSNLFSMPLWLGLVAFAAGWMTAKFASFIGSRAIDLDAPDHHREIRALEAQLRIARKEADQDHEKLAESTLELESLRESLDSMEQTSQFHKDELEKARQVVKQEATKVVELRRELTDRAEETIRAQVMARDSENQLSLIKASSGLELDRGDPDEHDEELFADLQIFDEEIAAESSEPAHQTDEPPVDGEDEARRSRPRSEGVSDC